MTHQVSGTVAVNTAVSGAATRVPVVHQAAARSRSDRRVCVVSANCQAMQWARPPEHRADPVAMSLLEGFSPVSSLGRRRDERSRRPTLGQHDCGDGSEPGVGSLNTVASPFNVDLLATRDRIATGARVYVAASGYQVNDMLGYAVDLPANKGRGVTFRNWVPGSGRDSRFSAVGRSGGWSYGVEHRRHGVPRHQPHQVALRRLGGPGDLFLGGPGQCVRVDSAGTGRSRRCDRRLRTVTVPPGPVTHRSPAPSRRHDRGRYDREALSGGGHRIGDHRGNGFRFLPPTHPEPSQFSPPPRVRSLACRSPTRSPAPSRSPRARTVRRASAAAVVVQRDVFDNTPAETYTAYNDGQAGLWTANQFYTYGAPAYVDWTLLGVRIYIPAGAPRGFGAHRARSRGRATTLTTGRRTPRRRTRSTDSRRRATSRRSARW